ncbi:MULTISPECIES: glycoside hydrolase [unclassified Ensifer]|uniref:glycoside hydrolase n=1 Tax=unclassified Ensifer TaxID=2633371 RepID=UPI0009F3801A|nr:MULTISPECIES: glycoside hydrolase [unclassified Ensifer]
MACCASFAGASSARADKTATARIGINRLNLAWLDRAEQERVLGEIAASGATHVRLSLSRPVDKSIEALDIANRLGLRILLEIQLANKSYYAETVRPRSGLGRIWDINRLSDLDLDRYRAGLGDALRRIDALGIRLDAVEPGNEINLAGYNGDLAVYQKPGRTTPRKISELADRAAFEKGLDNYIAALKITRDELRASVNSRDAAMISAGLSDMGPKEADRQGMERLDPAEMIGLLKARGMDELVDAYGIHIYPARKNPTAIQSVVTKLLDFCEPAGQGRPCWVTEWGIANTARACPVDDREREGAIAAMRAVFGDFAKAKRLDAAFYYDWDTQQTYRLWRCGALSPAGALAIEPEKAD